MCGTTPPRKREWVWVQQQLSIVERLRAAPERVAAAAMPTCTGRVTSVLGLAAEVDGLTGQLAVGDRVQLAPRSGPAVTAEVVGIKGDRARALAFGDLNGVGSGATATLPMRLADSPGDAIIINYL